MLWSDINKYISFWLRFSIITVFNLEFFINFNSVDYGTIFHVSNHGYQVNMWHRFLSVQIEFTYLFWCQTNQYIPSVFNLHLEMYTYSYSYRVLFIFIYYILVSLSMHGIHPCSYIYDLNSFSEIHKHITHVIYLSLIHIWRCRRRG